MNQTPMPKILIVEDDEGHAILIRANLEAAGVTYPIEHFRDGQAVLDFLAAGRPRPDETFIVLLDIRMPKIDGIEVLRRLRANPETRLTPVVILTSSREEQDLIAGYELGANSYIRKPVDFQQFSEAVRTLGLYWLVLNEPPPA